jgi:hypothetical protein
VAADKPDTKNTQKIIHVPEFERHGPRSSHSREKIENRTETFFSFLLHFFQIFILNSLPFLIKKLF